MHVYVTLTDEMSQIRGKTQNSW